MQNSLKPILKPTGSWALFHQYTLYISILHKISDYALYHISMKQLWFRFFFFFHVVFQVMSNMFRSVLFTFFTFLLLVNLSLFMEASSDAHRDTYTMEISPSAHVQGSVWILSYACFSYCKGKSLRHDLFTCHAKTARQFCSFQTFFFFSELQALIFEESFTESLKKEGRKYLSKTQNALDGSLLLFLFQWVMYSESRKMSFFFLFLVTRLCAQLQNQNPCFIHTAHIIQHNVHLTSLSFLK